VPRCARENGWDCGIAGLTTNNNIIYTQADNSTFVYWSSGFLANTKYIGEKIPFWPAATRSLAAVSNIS